MKVSFIKNKNFILLFILIFLAILLFKNFFIVQYSDYHTSTQLLKNKLDTLKTLQFNYSNLDENELILLDIQKEYIDANKIPMLNDYYNGIFETYNLIKSNNLIEIESYILNDEEIENNFISDQLHIKVTGNLSSIINFIHNVNNLTNYSQINFININSENTLNKNELQLEIYIKFLGVKNKLFTTENVEYDIKNIDDIFYINEMNFK